MIEEPAILLRASDPLAFENVLRVCSFTQSHGFNMTRINSILDHASKMQDYVNSEESIMIPKNHKYTQIVTVDINEVIRERVVARRLKILV